MILEIIRVRNLVNHAPSRFNLLAGDLCYARAQGDIQPIINPNGPNGDQPSSRDTPQPAADSGGWDYYGPWIWSSWFPMIEPSAAAIPWMFATGNHEPELFSSRVAAGHVTVPNYAVTRYQVDLAVQGHNHVYERTNPLVYDPATNSAKSSQQAVSCRPPSQPRSTRPPTAPPT